MQKVWQNTNVQAVFLAVAKGVVGAALAYFVFLLKHVHDYETIIGTCGIVMFVPLAGLLHIAVPALPGVALMGLRPRQGGTTPAAEQAIPTAAPVTAAVDAPPAIGHQIVPETVAPPMKRSHHSAKGPVPPLETVSDH